MKTERLHLPDIAEWLEAHSDWNWKDEGIERTFLFRDFVAAFGFITQIALLAERAGHHPEWFNVYNRVNVRLSTHDAGGLTKKDLTLAEEINGAWGNLQP